MGFFKSVGRIGTNIGKAVKKAGKDTFNEVKRHPGVYGTAAGLLLPGLGTVAGAAIEKAVGAASKIPGIAKVGSAAAKVGGAVNRVKGVLPDIPDVVKTAGKDVLGDVTRRAVGMGPDKLLGAAGTIDAAVQRRGATDLENRGLDRLRGAYDAKAGLRSQGIAGMSRPERDIAPDLASVYRVDTGNPYAARMAAPMGAPRPVAPGGPGPAPIARVPARAPMPGARTAADMVRQRRLA